MLSKQILDAIEGLANRAYAELIVSIGNGGISNINDSGLYYSRLQNEIDSVINDSNIANEIIYQFKSRYQPQYAVGSRVAIALKEDPSTAKKTTSRRQQTVLDSIFIGKINNAVRSDSYGEIMHLSTFAAAGGLFETIKKGLLYVRNEYPIQRVR